VCGIKRFGILFGVFDSFIWRSLAVADRAAASTKTALSGGFADFFSGFGAGVNEARRVEPFEGAAIEREPLALENRRALPMQSEETEIFDGGLRVFGAATFAVEVVDSQEEFSARCLCPSSGD